jgi:DNA-binding HxlR family transcriptional regulator
MKQGNIRETETCRAVSNVLSRIGDKWSVLIVSRLGSKPLRFNEIKREIAGISQRMLTLTLRGLERDGLITRTVFAVIPPRVDYELTALGRSLLVPVQALASWALQNAQKIELARMKFDGKKDAPVRSRASSIAPSASRIAT